MLTRWNGALSWRAIGRSLRQPKGPRGLRRRKRCFNTYLALWRQRADWPPGMKPFEDFETYPENTGAIEPGRAEALFFAAWFLLKRSLRMTKSMRVTNLNALRRACRCYCTNFD